MVPDELTQAVLARADVARYLRSDRGGIGGRERVFAYLEELRTTQRYQFYRALKHPLYPILRKIERARYDVFKRRIRVARPRRALIALDIWSRALLAPKPRTAR